jgi:hypothetical protein
MNIFERFQGVFASPKKTLEAVAAKPVWVDALILLLIVMAVYSYIIAPIAQRESLAMFQNNPRLEERMGKERFDKYIAAQSNPSPGRRYFNALVMSPVASAVGFFISTLFLLILGRLVATTGTFKDVLAVFLHASFIDKILGNAVRLALILAKKSVFQTSTGLLALFPTIPFGSTAYYILAPFDLFQIWMYGVLAYGLAAVFKIELKKALYVSYGFFILKSALYIGLGLLSRSLMGL